MIHVDSFLLRCLGLDGRYRNFGGVEVMIDSFLLRCCSWYILYYTILLDYLFLTGARRRSVYLSFVLLLLVHVCITLLPLIKKENLTFTF
jgi:hypothetical protein